MSILDPDPDQVTRGGELRGMVEALEVLARRGGSSRVRAHEALLGELTRHGDCEDWEALGVHGVPADLDNHQRGRLPVEHPAVFAAISQALRFRAHTLPDSERPRVWQPLLDYLRARYPSKDPRVLLLRGRVAAARRTAGEISVEVRDEYQAVLEMRSNVLGPDAYVTSLGRQHLASILNDLGEASEALAAIEREHGDRIRRYGSTHLFTLVALAHRASILIKQANAASGGDRVELATDALSTARLVFQERLRQLGARSHSVGRARRLTIEATSFSDTFTRLKRWPIAESSLRALRMAAIP